jgi:hypothetical protein
MFEPFFHTEAIAAEIKRRETVTEQRKWSLYYEKWGCLVCETKDKSHKSIGMCRTCYFKTRAGLCDAIKRAEAECEARPVPVVRDLSEVAHKALARKP